MGFLADIIRSIADLFRQALESELKALCNIIKQLGVSLAWVIFAVLLMFLGAIFTIIGICNLLAPLLGQGLANIIIGVIVILIGLVIIHIAGSCCRK